MKDGRSGILSLAWYVMEWLRVYILVAEILVAWVGLVAWIGWVEFIEWRGLDSFGGRLSLRLR